MAADASMFRLGGAFWRHHIFSMRASLALALVLAAGPTAAFAADGWAVCVALDPSGQGRMAHTAQPYARDSGRVDADAVGFVRAAAAAGLNGQPSPACHWEPTRDKASDYLRRLKQGAGKKGDDPLAVTFSPAS